jgi:hypothetical protein
MTELCNLYQLSAADIAVLFMIDPRTASRWAGGYIEPTGLARAFAAALVARHSPAMQKAVRRAVALGGPGSLLLSLSAAEPGDPKALRALVEAGQ